MHSVPPAQADPLLLLQRVHRLQQQLDSLVDQALAPPTAEAPTDEFEDDWDAFDEVPVASTSSAQPPRKHIIFSTDLETGTSFHRARLARRLLTSGGDLVAVRSADPSSLLSKRPRPSTTTAAPPSKRRKGKGKLLPVVDVAALAAEEAQRVADATVRLSFSFSPFFLPR